MSNKIEIIKGLQVTALRRIYHIPGSNKVVSYYEGIESITVDTRKGNFLIKEVDLLEYINSRRNEKDDKSKEERKKERRRLRRLKRKKKEKNGN